MLGLLLATLNVSRPAIFFSAVSNAHANMGTASITALLETNDNQGKNSKKFELRVRWPNEIRLREFVNTSKLVHDRTIESDRVIDYDPVIEQYVVTKRETEINAAGELAKVDKDLDDLLLGFCDPQAMSVWLEPMKTLQPWTVTSKVKTVEAKYVSSGNTILLSLERGTAKLVGVSMVAPSNKIIWKMTYGKSVSGLSFVMPENATEVPYFDKEMLPPRYASKESKAIATKMFSAYDGLSSLGYIVKRSNGKTTILLSLKFARQEDDRAIWTYDGKVVTLFDKSTKKWYQQQATFTEVIESVASIGTRVDPTLRLLMTGFNPYRKRLGDNATLRTVGSMKLNGNNVLLLASESKNATITLAVREKDGLVVNSIYRATGGGEVGQETVNLSFDYFPVPSNATTQYRLSVPSGVKTVAFPNRPKSS